eukprot:gi/632984376/ref/XP_007909110.1/ PREDICTED: interleukin-12 receptor subunit beta-2-like isoform X2 [Callorhinchus milii]
MCWSEQSLAVCSGPISLNVTPVFRVGESLPVTCEVVGRLPAGCHTPHLRLRLNGETLNATGRGLISATIPGSNHTRANVSCSLHCPGQAPVLCEEGLRGGDAPTPPEELMCFRLGMNAAMNCTWRPSRGGLLPTQYHLHLQQSSDLRVISTGQTSVQVQREQLKMSHRYRVWVTANNSLGERRSQTIQFKIETIVWLEAPSGLRKDEADSRSLGIVWKNPTSVRMFSELCVELGYRQAGTAHWKKVAEQDLGENSEHYALEELLPFTGYELRIRCRQKEANERLWSHWSPVVTAWTEEDSPLGKLDVWIVPRQPGASGGNITVIWKRLPEARARGRISYYTVWYQSPDGPHLLTLTMCCTHTLPTTISLFNITAKNSQGSTEPARLSLNTGLPAAEGVRMEMLNGSVWVSWLCGGGVLEYVLDWRPLVSGSNNSFNWRKIPAQNMSITVTLGEDEMLPFTAYNLSVHTLYHQGLGQPVSSLIYTRQAAPVSSPRLMVRNVMQTWAMLGWEELPLADQRGFVVNYTLYLGTSPSPPPLAPVMRMSSDSRQFVLTDLTPATSYYVWITASTRVGEGPRGRALRFDTQESQNFLLLISVIFIIFLVIFITAACVHKRTRSLTAKLLPQWCCQRIPDASNSKAAITQTRLAVAVAVDVLQTPGLELEPVIAEVEETELEEITTPLTPDPSPEGLYWSKPPSESTAQPVITSTVTYGYEKHFLPNPEDLIYD